MAFPKEYKEVLGIEEPNWYDGVAYWLYDWKKYSRNWVKLSDNPMVTELCKYWSIYTVSRIRDGDWPFDYHFEVLNVRPDRDEDEEGYTTWGLPETSDEG